MWNPFRKKVAGKDFENDMLLEAYKEVFYLKRLVQDLDNDIKGINAMIILQNQEIFYLKSLVEQVCKKNTDAMQIVEILNEFRDEERRLT